MIANVALTAAHLQADALANVGKLGLVATARRMGLPRPAVLSLLAEVDAAGATSQPAQARRLTRTARKAEPAQRAPEPPDQGGPSLDEVMAFVLLQLAVRALPDARHMGGEINAAVLAVMDALTAWRAA